MPIVTRPDGLSAFVFESLLEIDGISHFVTSRIGGVSRPPFDALNMAYSVGDEPDHVGANRKLVCRTFGVPLDGLTCSSQVHGSSVRVVGPSLRGRGGAVPDSAMEETDGLITRLHDTCVMVLVADCVPVLMCDPGARVVAAVHAGWRGTVSRIVVRAVAMMVEKMGCSPSNIRCGLGPAIGQADYEVGGDVIDLVAAAVPADLERVASSATSGTWRLDLHAANRILLEDVGIPAANIETAPDSTFSTPDLYYSARRDGIRTGRMAAAIMLRSVTR